MLQAALGPVGGQGNIGKAGLEDGQNCGDQSLIRHKAQCHNVISIRVGLQLVPPDSTKNYTGQSIGILIQLPKCDGFLGFHLQKGHLVKQLGILVEQLFKKLADDCVLGMVILLPSQATLVQLHGLWSAWALK